MLSATFVASPADAAETVTFWMLVMPRSFFITVV